MRLGFIVIGLVLVGSAATLSAVGTYDGVLGATTAGQILSPGGPTHGVVRVVVDGTPHDAEAQFAAYRIHLVLPSSMERDMASSHFVPVRFEADHRPAFLSYDDAPPAPGSLLVVTAALETHWPLASDLESGHAGQAQPVIFLDGREFHEPLVFR